VRQRLKELALERTRFGYRRLHIMLQRQGIVLNRKKLYRLYREERLTVRKRGGRKQALGTGRRRQRDRSIDFSRISFSETRE
jgi:putative transposase